VAPGWRQEAAQGYFELLNALAPLVDQPRGDESRSSSAVASTTLRGITAIVANDNNRPVRPAIAYAVEANLRWQCWARRKFITLLGDAAAWPLAARAQQSERMRRIGVLMSYAADDPAGQARLLALAQELAQSGWIDGRNVRIDVRWGAVT
jgi:hypothetical protein